MLILFKVSTDLQIGLCAQFRLMYLPYKTFYLGSAYSAAYNSYNPANDSNCLHFCSKMPEQGSWYCELNMHQSLSNKDIKKEINNLYSVVHKNNVCNMK